MSRIERNARIPKHDSDKYVRISNYIKNCSAPPPPPPFGDEKGWDLQFCKWWGWNWVRKEQNYVGEIDRDLLFGARPLNEQITKNVFKMRGAGDIPLQKPKYDKYRYFKQIRNFFLKIKHASSFQKIFNASSTSHRCYCPTYSYGIKEKTYVPFADDKRCYLEHKGRERGDSSGSTSIDLCSSSKEMERKQYRNDLLITKTDSYQQTQETRKTKKKRYYHLVCNSCYPEICCCRCHKQSNPNEIHYYSSPVKSNPKDSTLISKYPNSTNKLGEKIKSKQISGDYDNQHADFLSRWRYQPQSYNVTPLRLHRCTQKDHANYVVSGEHKKSYQHNSHPFYSEHRDYGNVFFDSKCKENREEVFNSQTIPEKENQDCLDVKNKQKYVFKEKPVSLKRRQSPIPILSESSYSDDALEYFCQNERNCNIRMKDQSRGRDEGTINNKRARWQEKNGRPLQEPRRRLRCQSFPETSKREDLCYIAQQCPTYHKPFKNLTNASTQPIPKHKTVDPKFRDINDYNSPNVPCKRPRTCDNPEKYEMYRDWNRVTFGKTIIPKFYDQKYSQMQNTRSDILDRHCSLNIEDEFFSPVSGKTYNLSPRSILDPDYYTSSSLPEPIDVADDLKYLDSLEATVNVDRRSRIMLDAVCDAILFNTNNKHLAAESTLIRKFTYPDVDKDIYNSKDDTPSHHSPTIPASRKSEVLFMEKVEALVKSILNSKLTQSEDVNGNIIKSHKGKLNNSPVLSEPSKTHCSTKIKTESQQTVGNSILEQINKFNHLFEKMDEATTQNKANVEKIQEAIQVQLKEDNLSVKDSTDQQYSVSLLDQIASTSTKEEKRRHPDLFEHVNQLAKNNDVFKITANKNALESSTSKINRIGTFNIQSTVAGSNPPETSRFMFKNVSDFPINSKIPVSQPALANSRSVPISRTRRVLKNVIKNRKLKTRIPVRKNK